MLPFSLAFFDLNAWMGIDELKGIQIVGNAASGLGAS